MRRKMSLFMGIALLLVLSGLLSPVQAAEPKINLQSLMSQKLPILLEFGRGWCIPCKYMKPILDDMNRAYSGKAIVMTVDMDANKDLVRDFRIRMMPTQVFLMPDGKEFFRNEGTLEREQIAMVFEKMGIQSSPGQAPGTAATAPRPVLPPPIPGNPGGAR
jgi:thioredoxin 1